MEPSPVQPAIWEDLLALKKQGLNYHNQIKAFSAYFLGVTYGTQLAIGSFLTLENPTISDISENIDFSYEFDNLDCLTYVETVLTLANIQLDKIKAREDFERGFKENLIKIRYKSEDTSYLYRHHFMSLDWIPNNLNLFEDITKNLSEKSLLARAEIKKSAFFSAQLKHKITAEQIEQVYPETKKQAATLNYIELTEIINHIEDYIIQFPEIGIVNIVRPNWDLTESIGTHLNVSHLGFCLKENDNLIFRHASQVDKKQVVELPLVEYLEKYLDSPTIKGVNVLKINEIYR